MNRMTKKWLNLLDRLGYKAEWDTVGYWENQLIAVDEEQEKKSQ